MKRLILVLFLFGLLLSGCAGAAPQESAVEPAVMEMPAAASAPDRAYGDEAGMEKYAADTAANQVDTQTIVQDRKIIYNANLDIVAEDTELVAKQVEALATSLGGYVANMNAYRGSQDQLYFNITLRIPAEQFDAARTALRDMALRVENENIGTDDVTDQYFDLDARLKTLRATETELLSLLAETRQRNGKVEDIMSIYRELTNIQSEIESLQGQLNRLDKLVSLSTISVNLRPDELSRPISSQWRPLETLRNSFRTLLNVLQGLIDLIIYLIVVALPTLVVLAIPVILLFLVVRWLIRRLRGRKSTEA